ncbi:MAG: threonylcarbamoyl-AMP synthase [Chloroflexi bacterium]|nr:threonylcarbamoyl-AMP synthase [Chloroflexota bacterium]
MATVALEKGGLIVLPTDTVYGVGALVEQDAIQRLFVAKKRPPDRPVPVLLSDSGAVMRVACEFPYWAQRLADVFWPGPLTLVLGKHPDLPPNLTTLPTVGVRVPDHHLSREIIAAAGGALAVTSANRSDQPPACTIQSAIRYLADAVVLYLDGGTCAGGVPSTVVTMEGNELRVLREGPITEQALRRVLGGAGT